MSDDSLDTQVIRIGDKIGVLYPEVYYHFISLLNKDHQDLIHAMQIAQVNFADFSAQEYLAIVLGVDIDRMMSMKDGYEILYMALQRRTAKGELANDVAKAIAFDKTNVAKFRNEEDIGKPLFGDFDELKDKEDFDKKKNWKENDSTGKYKD